MDAMKKQNRHGDTSSDTAVSLKKGDFTTPPVNPIFQKENGGLKCNISKPPFCAARPNENGLVVYASADYYYVNSYCKVITNQRYWVSKTNDLLPAAFYNFDAEGKMTDAPIPTPAPDPDPNPNPEVKNGIVSEDGELYYYVDGAKTYAGLIQIDGDYYYVNSYCKVITSQRYWVSKTNNLLPATFYTFGADGKMVR